MAISPHDPQPEQSNTGPLPPHYLGGQPPQAPQYPPQQQWSYPPPNQWQGWPPRPAERRKGLAIAALVLGIGSVVFSFTLAVLSFPALGAAVTGLVLACVAYADQTMAKWALWISLAGIGLALYDVIVFIRALQNVTGTG